MPRQSSYQSSATLLRAAADAIEKNSYLTIGAALNGVVRHSKIPDAWGIYGQATLAFLHFGGWLNRSVPKWEKEHPTVSDRVVMLRMCATWCDSKAAEVADWTAPPSLPLPTGATFRGGFRVVCCRCSGRINVERKVFKAEGEEISVICPACEKINYAQVSPLTLDRGII